ncbi:MAG: HEAT repeat domain-containing protein [Phycisphaerae bacterium]|nr:HEAT repeat domain-containing protein [Phycisphaerae bacterium]
MTMPARLAIAAAMVSVAVAVGGCAHPMRGHMPPRASIPKEAPAQVRKNIRHLYGGPQERAQACLNLRRGPEAVAATAFLIPLLGDDTLAWSPSFFLRVVGTPVRLEAMDTLVSIGEPAIEPLIAALGHDVEGVRSGAALTLGRIGDLRALDPLEQAAAGDPSESVRVAAGRALVGIPSLRTLGRIAVALTDWDHSVRETAFRSLRRLNDPQGDPLLVALLESEPWRGSRDRILDVLHQQGRVDVVAIAVAGMNDPDDFMRAPCATRLAEWQDPRGQLPLIRALGDSYGDVRASAVDGLAKFGTSDAVRALCEAVTDRWERVSDDACAALIRLNNPAAIAPLVEVMDRVPSRCAACREVLKSLTGEDFGCDAEAWRAWATRRGLAGAMLPCLPEEEAP